MAARSSCVAGLTVAALAALGLTTRSLHVNPFGGHLDDHPLLIWSEALEFPAGVNPRELADVLLRALSDQLRAAPDCQHVAVGTGGIEDRDRDPVVARQIASLQARKAVLKYTKLPSVSIQTTVASGLPSG